MARWSGLTADEMQVLDATFWSGGGSRHGMAERLGFSRSKANGLIAGLVEQGLLTEAGLQQSSGGRRAENLQLHGNLGVLVGVDIGATSLDVAVLRLDLSVMVQRTEVIDVRQGPGVVLARMRALMRDVLAESGATAKAVVGIGIGVPGPVNFGIGQLVNPPLMPGWDSFSIRDYLREDYAAPVFVDNDVNLMALAESWRLQRSLSNFLVIKVGTGIGCGIVCHGEVYRGATGSAGDVGHICVDQAGPRCHCGNLGCVEAMAAGPAITRLATEAAETGQSVALADILRAQGHIDATDVGLASRAGDASQQHHPARGQPDWANARVGGQLLQPVACVYRWRHHPHRPFVSRCGAAKCVPTLTGTFHAPPRNPVHAARRPGRRRGRGCAGHA